MLDFTLWLCGHGETKDATAWSLCNLFRKSNYKFDVKWISGDALIGRARSVACTRFLQANESPYMIFIDTDIVFGQDDIEKIYKELLVGREVIAGAYSVMDGKNLAIQGYESITWDGRVVEARYISTGFMGIARDTLLKIKESLALPLLHKGVWCECYAFFESGQAPDEKIYLSEDWEFCQKVRRAGMKVYLHTGVMLDHIKERRIGAMEALQSMVEREKGRLLPITEDLVVQSTLVSDLAEFLKMSEEEVYGKLNRDPAKVVADEWTSWVGSKEDFYKQNKSYIFDLAKFNHHPIYWSDKVAPVMSLKDKAILDIGCGIGSVALHLGRLRNTVIGYDVNPYLIEFCSFRNQKFGLGGVSFTTEFPDVSKFDYVLAIDVLEHIEDMERFLKELGRDMKKEARLYHVDSFKDDKPMHLDHSAEIDKWLKDAGFIVWNSVWAIKRE